MNPPKTWIVKVQHPGLSPYWIGNYFAANRAAAKKEARKFVSAFVPTDCKIVCIAEGYISMQLDGPEIPYEENTS